MVKSGARRLPPLGWLRAFEATARRSSFTAAADELGLTQAAVSQHVRLLEEWCGTRLFHREARSIRLTDAGRSFLVPVAEALDTVERGAVECFGARRSSAISVRLPPAIATLWWPSRAAEFFRRFRGLPIRIVSTVWIDEPAEDEVDFAIWFGSRDTAPVGAVELTRDRVVPVGAPGADPIAGPQALARATPIRVAGCRTGWGRWCEAAWGPGGSVPGTCEVDTESIAIAMAEAGAGVALARLPLCSRLIEAGRIQKLHELVLPTDEGYFLLPPSAVGIAGTVADWFAEVFGERASDSSNA